VAGSGGGENVAEEELIEENNNDIGDGATSDSSSSIPDPPVQNAAVQNVGVRTRLQKGIRNPKKYTDGTVRYGMFSSTGEPCTHEEALNDARWSQAMQEEYDALIANKTWHLVPPNRSRNLIDCKWVYRIKKKADGTIDRYKARLVAKGFKQR
jgi:hypothetical protein